MTTTPPYTTLITVADLEKRLDDFCILDCRASLADPHYGANAYAQGHIAGAQRADLDRDLAAKPGAAGRHPLPDADSLSERLRAWGLNAQAQLVVYDDAGGAFAARAWWLVRWLGHEHVALLDGGITAWSGALQSKTPDALRGNFERLPATTRIATVEQLNTEHDFQLIDARAEARFHGREEPIDPVAGHIPGAVCRPFQGNLQETGCFLPPERLAERFEGMTNPVCYCGSGVTAAHNVLAMRHAGLGEPALYPGSWSEWIRDPARPVAT